MVYISGQRLEEQTDTNNLSAFIDPMIIRAARIIYNTYLEVHPNISQRPLGIVIDRYSYRGHLIFHRKPALLPKEFFVPFNQLESEYY